MIGAGGRQVQDKSRENVFRIAGLVSG